ncbi:hypothetical protein ABZY68_25530 [Streptomyces sp. NPDC006482]|uniref:hypothetical protein n=1 Tax=Streptomyces sp. NPDC006482 TaxID=3154306 RepID=UPI0033A9873F
MTELLPRHPAPNGAAVPVFSGTQPQHRKLVTLYADADDTPARAQLCTALTYAIWGLDTESSDRLALVAQDLVEHMADRVLSDTLLLLIDLDPGLATLCAIAPSGELWEPLEPNALPHVDNENATGVTHYALGPGAYVRVEVTRP